MTVKQINVNQIENHMSEQLSPYINERLDDQISWYGKKSAYNKLRFRICQLIIIVASALIPIINLGIPLTEVDPIQVLRITAILGGVITIVTALSQMDAYFETWVLYRTTGEALKRERFLYINNAADYSGLAGEEKNKLLVERVEALLSSENSKFLSLQQQGRQQSEKQLNDLLQRQRDINEQQKEEIQDLREFREKYEQSSVISSNKIELVRTTLTGIKYPTNKLNILTYVEQNKEKIMNADSVINVIEKLPSNNKDYTNIEEILNELMDTKSSVEVDNEDIKKNKK
jgi:hypothetical protein